MRGEDNIKVSILVPFYNVGNYVGRCVDSLFSQTYENIEYIFVNDCSPDKSMEIIRGKMEDYHISEKCKMIVHERNMGISASRNDCLDNISGDYFLFVDSDDYIEKDMVELMVAAASKDNADIVGCGYVEEFPDRHVEYPQKYSNDHVEMMKAITMLTIKGVLWKLLVNTKILKEHSEIRFDPANNMGEDYLFCCQLFYYAKTFASVDKCLYHYVQYNPNNVTKTTVHNVECQAFAIREVERFYREKGVYDLLQDELLKRKFICKLPLLLDKNCRDVQRWRDIFPENNDVWRELNFSRGNCLLFRIAQSPFYWLIYIYYFLIKIL